MVRTAVMRWMFGFVAVLVFCLSFFAANGELTGIISCKMCGGDHKGQDPVKCTLSCVDHGSTYVLVVSSSRILNIENQSDPKIAIELRKQAGRRVSVTGTQSKDGKGIKVIKISS